jgi:hypothetical protein
MATQPQQQASTPEQYNLVYTLKVEPGIKRDGTTFEAREYSDGVWCRFQRLIPKKMGGYRQLFSTFSGILRGIILNAYDGVNYVFGGTSQGIDVFVTGTSVGAGSGPYVATFTPGYSSFPIYSLPSTTSFRIRSYAATPISYASVFPAGTQVIFSQSGTPVVYTTVGTPTFSTPDTTVTVTTTIAGSPTNVWFLLILFILFVNGAFVPSKHIRHNAFIFFTSSAYGINFNTSPNGFLFESPSKLAHTTIFLSFFLTSHDV